MDLAIISDTHISEHEETVPEPFSDRIAAADHTIHAGDLNTVDALKDLRELATELTAVHGNADPSDIGLPVVNSVTLEGSTFVVTHGTLNPVEAAVYPTDGLVMNDDAWRDTISDTARARTRAWNGEGVIGIGGHSHKVMDEIYEGVRVLNPGSATGREVESATMMTAEIDDDQVEVALHEAEPLEPASK